jgi:uncharacterized protein (DUF952 family)
MALICHIARAADWEEAKAQGEYTADSLQSQGFIHCSTPEQLIPVANFLFRGQNGLVLLAIDELLVQAEIRYENLEGGAKLFPHVYGPIEAAAVIGVLEFAPQADGTFVLPPEVGQLAEMVARK